VTDYEETIADVTFVHSNSVIADSNLSTFGFGINKFDLAGSGISVVRVLYKFHNTLLWLRDEFLTEATEYAWIETEAAIRFHGCIKL
jgi:hypothetical protein